MGNMGALLQFLLMHPVGRQILMHLVNGGVHQGPQFGGGLYGMPPTMNAQPVGSEPGKRRTPPGGTNQPVGDEPGRRGTPMPGVPAAQGFMGATMAGPANPNNGGFAGLNSMLYGGPRLGNL